jgi:hypothetical protein
MTTTRHYADIIQVIGLVRHQIICLGLLIIPQFILAQSALSASGNQITGSGGAMSFTVGQVVFSSKPGTSGKVNEGVQQVYPAKITPVNELVHLREVLLFPNPTDDLLTIQISDINPERIAFKVLDSSGKEINSGLFQFPQTTISFRGLPPGTYHIFLKTHSEFRPFKVVKI